MTGQLRDMPETSILSRDLEKYQFCQITTYKKITDIQILRIYNKIFVIIIENLYSSFILKCTSTRNILLC